MVARNTDIDISGGEFGSAVNAAAATGHDDITRYLVDKGASLLLKNLRGHAALHLATIHGHANTVNFLLSKEADMPVVDNHSFAPLHVAAHLMFLKQSRTSRTKISGTSQAA